MFDEIQLEELKIVCSEICALSEGGKHYIFFPRLKIRHAETDYVVRALLCPTEHSSYPTKLFLSEKIPAPLNWNFSSRILDSTWYSWSWRDVSASLRLIQMLAGHLAAFR